jgi:hypothetical protein
MELIGIILIQVVLFIYYLLLFSNYSDIKIGNENSNTYFTRKYEIFFITALVLFCFLNFISLPFLISGVTIKIIIASLNLISLGAFMFNGFISARNHKMILISDTIGILSLIANIIFSTYILLF